MALADVVNCNSNRLVLRFGAHNKTQGGRKACNKVSYVSKDAIDSICRVTLLLHAACVPLNARRQFQPAGGRCSARACAGISEVLRDHMFHCQFHFLGLMVQGLRTGSCCVQGCSFQLNMTTDRREEGQCKVEARLGGGHITVEGLVQSREC